MPNTTLQAFENRRKLTAKAAIDLGLERSFDGFCDLSLLEPQLKANGIEIRQITGKGLVPGSVIRITKTPRKTLKNIDISVEEYDRPYQLSLLATADAFDAELTLHFRERQADLTFVRMDVKARAKTLSARLALHAVRLTKNRRKRQMTRALRKYCRYLEKRVGAFEDA